MNVSMTSATMLLCFVFFALIKMPGMTDRVPHRKKDKDVSGAVIVQVDPYLAFCHIIVC